MLHSLSDFTHFVHSKGQTLAARRLANHLLAHSYQWFAVSNTQIKFESFCVVISASKPVRSCLPHLGDTTGKQ